MSIIRVSGFLKACLLDEERFLAHLLVRKISRICIHLFILSECPVPFMSSREFGHLSVEVLLSPDGEVFLCFVGRRLLP